VAEAENAAEALAHHFESSPHPKKHEEKNMRYINSIPVALVLFMFAAARAAEEPADTKQKAFPTPNDAFKALVEGLEKNSDEQLLDVLGHSNKDLIVQSDKEASTQMREKVSKLAKEHVKIEDSGDKAIACFGNKCWPFPIPLVKGAEGWKFDTAAGKEEILNRRIGRDELKAIKFMDAYDDAQRAYATVDRTGDKVAKYAQKLISSKGKKDGLYWAVPEGSREEASPLAGLFEEGQDFLDGDGTDIPYNGYYFKVLTKQGSNAPNGKYNYVINGNMIAGFALVGWPADYGTSGIMTFVISQQGIIYQKDLGADTAKLATAMDEYNPDAGWKDLKPEDK
jgi:hypothetical protein